MDIRNVSLLEGATQAEGTAVIIDVFRAFTTAAVALANGAEKIILVSEVEQALTLKANGVATLCIGEVDGIKPKNFDFGNSPHEISDKNFHNVSLIQSTRAGTVGANAATKASRIYVSSLVTANATAAAILSENPEFVTLVAMGSYGKFRTDEDEQCGLYIRNLLGGRQPDKDSVRNLILVGEEAQKYDDPALLHFDPMDRVMALEIDKYNFSMPVTNENGLLTIRKSS